MWGTHREAYQTPLVLLSWIKILLDKYILNLEGILNLRTIYIILMIFGYEIIYSESTNTLLGHGWVHLKLGKKVTDDWLLAALLYREERAKKPIRNLKYIEEEE